MIMITENLHRFTLRPKLLRGLRAGYCVFPLHSGVTQAQEHFNPKGSGATGHTSSLQAELRETLPFADERDFEGPGGGSSPNLIPARSSAHPEISCGTWPVMIFF